MYFKVSALLVVLSAAGCSSMNGSSSDDALLNDRHWGNVNLEMEISVLQDRIELLESKVVKLQQDANSQIVKPQTFLSKEDTALNVKGLSYGGIMRSGPNIRSVKIKSLRQGDKITLLERNSAVMNNYPWFKIKTADGVVGYQWGGILCSYGTEFVGAYRFCE